MSVDTAQRQLSQACDALDRALRSGAEARAETWLDACPIVAGDDDLAVELIFNEFVVRESLGRTPAPEEFYSRFPKFRDRLQRLFGVDELLRRDGAASSIDDGVGSTHPAAPPITTPAPRRVGQYELLEKLGDGGMGVVFRARQQQPARDVAVKILRSGADAAAIELARFQREARAAARLQHPNIATVFEAGDDNGQPYLVMEYVRGGDLRMALAKRPLPADVAAELVKTLAKAVDYAHSLGVVHRDLKPANILVNGPQIGEQQTRQIKITDFGLAALIEPGKSDGLTRTGQLLGTTAYMAPEQASGTAQAANPAVDIYSLGAVLYECLTGRPPFVAESEATTLHLVLHEDPVPPRKLNPEVPRDLETIALKCLAKLPDRRYPTAQALAEDIERFQKHVPIIARPTGFIERTVKWTKRHPATAAVFVAAVLSLSAIGVLTGIYTTNLQRTLKDVEFQRNRAELQEIATGEALAAESRRRSQARLALDQLTDQLIKSTQGGVIKPDDQRQQLLQTLAAYQEFAADPAKDEAGQLAVIAAQRQAARIQHLRKTSAECLATLAAAEKLAHDSTKTYPNNSAFREQLAGVLNDRARYHQSNGQYVEAVADAMQSAEVERTLPDAEKPDGQYRRGRVLMVVIVAGRRANLSAEAEKAQREAQPLFEKLVADDPKTIGYRAGLAGIYQNQAVDLDRKEQNADALALYQKASAVRCPDGTMPNNVEDRVAQADCLQATGRMLERLKQIPEAVREYRAALAAWDLVLVDRRNTMTHVRGLVNTLKQMEKYPEQTNNGRDLDVVYEHIRQRIEKSELEGLDSSVVVLFCECLINHGHALVSQQRYKDALAEYTSAGTTLAQYPLNAPDHTRTRHFFVRAMVGSGRALHLLGRDEEALATWDKIIGIETGLSAAYQQLERAKALAATGRGTEAVNSATGVVLDDPSLLLARAAIYSLASGVDDANRAEYQVQAMAWLEKARAAGKLEGAAARAYLQTNRDWKAMRDHPEFEKLIKVKK